MDSNGLHSWHFSFLNLKTSWHNNFDFYEEGILWPFLPDDLGHFVGPGEWLRTWVFLLEINQNDEPRFLSFLDCVYRQIDVLQTVTFRHISQNDFADQAKLGYVVFAHARLEYES